MATTREEIRNWIKRGKKEKATHMLVVVDTFDYEDYPVFVKVGENVYTKEHEYNQSPMQRVMEVYNLSKDIEPQLAQDRSFNY